MSRSLPLPPGTFTRQGSLPPLPPLTIPSMDEDIPTAMNTMERTTHVSQFFFRNQTLIIYWIVIEV